MADEALEKFLEEHHFEKNLKKLKKKLKNKTIVIYGAGQLFQIALEKYDFEGLNIIGISDKKFENHAENETAFGFKAYAPSELRELNPDYILVATLKCINVIENLYYDTLKGTKIKIQPLVRRSLFALIKEIWG